MENNEGLGFRLPVFVFTCVLVCEESAALLFGSVCVLILIRADSLIQTVRSW